MEKSESKLLITNCLKWYASQLIIDERKNAVEITTPFTNVINDRVSVFVVSPNDSDDTLEITDDGITLNEADMFKHGTTVVRADSIARIVKHYGVQLNGDVITTGNIKKEQFPQKTHAILHAILSINALSHVVKK